MWTGLIYQTRGGNKKVKLTVTYYMCWKKISSGRRYESSDGRAFIVCGRSKGSLGWSSITRPAGSVMLQKREEKKQKNMSAQ